MAREVRAAMTNSEESKHSNLNRKAIAAYRDQKKIRSNRFQLLALPGMASIAVLIWIYFAFAPTIELHKAQWTLMFVILIPLYSLFLLALCSLDGTNLQPPIEATKDGVRLENGPLIRLSEIPWEEIKGTRVYSIFGSDFVALETSLSSLLKRSCNLPTTLYLLFQAPFSWLFRVPYLCVSEEILYLKASEVALELETLRREDAHALPTDTGCD